MAHGCAREEESKGKRRMEWVASGPMGSFVSLEDRIWFLRKCHYIPLLRTCESLDVSEQDADVFIAVNINLVELVGHKGTFLFFLGNISYHFFGNEVRQNCGQSW